MTSYLYIKVVDTVYIMWIYIIMTIYILVPYNISLIHGMIMIKYCYTIVIVFLIGYHIFVLYFLSVT